jgi:hypothetical protein
MPFFPRFIDYNDEDYDPQTVLEVLFNEYSFDDLREMLWDMFKSALLNDSAYGERKERSNLIFFFERTNDLMTAIHVLIERKKAKSS